jgi:hypothetical protein
MIGEAARNSSSCGYHVDVAIAIVFASECDQRAVGREVRKRLRSNSGGETVGVASVTRDNPEIASVIEDDLRLADRWVAEKQGRIRLGDGYCGENRYGKQHQAKWLAHVGLRTGGE